MNEVKGDLIELALQGNFDVITHGCNCFCTMGAGIAVSMKYHFGVAKFPKEDLNHRGDFDKLGTIDWDTVWITQSKKVLTTRQKQLLSITNKYEPMKELIVVNSYTQYSPSASAPPYNIPLDYDALRMCFRKINYFFPKKHLGVPWIGAGLAKGDWNRVKQIIEEETTKMEVTAVEYAKSI